MVLFGGSWVAINGVLSRVAILVSDIRGLLTPLVTTHEPPSRFWKLRRVRANKLQASQALGSGLRFYVCKKGLKGLGPKNVFWTLCFRLESFGRCLA